MADRPTININLKQLRSIVRLLERRNVSEFEFEDDHVRIRLVRGGGGAGVMTARVAHAAPAPADKPAPVASEPAHEGNVAYVTSPFVGTFYRSPSPDAPPFV